MPCTAVTGRSRKEEESGAPSGVRGRRKEMTPNPQAVYVQDLNGGSAVKLGWSWKLDPNMPNTVHLIGNCPICGHTLHETVHVFITGNFVRRNISLPEWPAYLPSEISCNCGEEHLGRPTTAPQKGCGALFTELDKIEVTQ